MNECREEGRKEIEMEIWVIALIFDERIRDFDKKERLKIRR